jgi:hypothetical protein
MTAVGQRVASRYRIVRPLGSGGLSSVWLATDERFGRPVALKVCPPPDGLTAAESELVRGWTLKEARAFARVRHPNVVRIRDVLDDGGAPWIVMEYIPSHSLLEIIEESGPVPPRRVAEIGLAVLAALGAAGRAGVLHLDVKPGNVLIGDDGRVLLTDFGPVVTGAGMAALASAGIAFGSPKYLAPERLQRGIATEESDLWSLGATLYHAVEGRPPYHRSTSEEVLQALADTAPESPLRAGPLTSVITGLLRREPAERLTADEAAKRMRRVVRGPGRRRRVAIAAGLALVSVTALGGSRVLGESTTSQAGPVTAAVAPAITLPPSGFTWWNDPAGFRIAVPAGWTVSRDDDGALLLKGPSGKQSVRVSRWHADDGEDTVATLVAQEQESWIKPGYHRIRIEPLPEPPDAVWEFTYGSMRGLKRVDGDYLIDWRSTTKSWPTGQSTLGLILESFRETRR